MGELSPEEKARMRAQFQAEDRGESIDDFNKGLRARMPFWYRVGVLFGNWIGMILAVLAALAIVGVAILVVYVIGALLVLGFSGAMDLWIR